MNIVCILAIQNVTRKNGSITLPFIHESTVATDICIYAHYSLLSRVFHFATTSGYFEGYIHIYIY